MASNGFFEFNLFIYGERKKETVREGGETAKHDEDGKSQNL